jgi:Flp pilus assembly protein TadD
MGKVSDPQRLRAGLAALNILAGDPESALREYGKLLAAKPDDMRYVVDKAVALDLLGHHDEAQLLYRRALSVLPDDPAVISDLALSLLLSGKRAEASSVIAPLRDADDLLPRLRNNVDVILAALPSASGSAPANASEDADGVAIQQIAQALNAAPRTAALEPR